VVAYRLALCCVLATSPALATGQEVAPPSDSIPFHQHQWAAQFGGGTNFLSLGFLRFTAPNRAWLIDFHFTGGHSHHYSYANDTLAAQGFTSNADVNARIGRRFYQTHGKAVVSFQTLGAVGGFTHRCAEDTPPTVGSCANGWTAGVFGELGAAYLVTRRFSIGGAGTLGFSYERTTFKAVGAGVVSREWSYQASIQGLSFAATVYF
jgi:hypothetical protein